jgi:soluble lytic murein transglycosylase-like protein
MLAMLSFALIAFLIILFRPLLDYSQTVTAAVLNPGSQKDRPVMVITFPRPKTTPTPPVEARRLDMTYEAMFQEIAPQYGLDWRVLEAVAYHESRMNYLAVGRANDMGMMQIIPSTWDQWAPKVGVYDPFDPYSNISVGAAYLAYVRDFCTRRGYPEPHWMLIAYNWGPKRVGELFDQGGNWDQVPPTQRRYASSILEMATTRAANAVTFEEVYPNLPIR